MKFIRPLRLAAAALLLSGCGLMKQKAADYYLGRARAIAESQNPPQEELENAFSSIDKALDYDPASGAAAGLLERLADTSDRTGFARGQELQLAALKKSLAGAPLNWTARESLINYFASRGDTGGLEAMSAQAAELAASPEPEIKYCALLSGLAARAASVPWLESEAYLSLNKSPETLFEKSAAYQAGAESASALRTELAGLAARDPALKRSAPAELVSAAEVGAADALKDKASLQAVTVFNMAVKENAAFRKAVEMTVQGNAALVKKDYSKARAFYQGALNHYPGLVDARRQLAETDFQEGASLAAAGEERRGASQLLRKAYAGASETISVAMGGGSRIPFVKADRFLGDSYALKAASISAMRAVEGKRLRNVTRLEAEFKAALDEALKLNPEGKLAGDLLARYTKEGF